MAISDTDREKELAAIKAHYNQRKLSGTGSGLASSFSLNIVAERELLYARVLKGINKPLAELTLLEIGAGNGNNLHFFHNLGIPWKNIVANELLIDRVEQLRKNCPEITVVPGDALDLPYESKFDLVFQSTVFTSILSDEFRQVLADKMWNMLKPGGIVLWYDFVYNNPANPNVKKVSRSEVRALFPKNSSVSFHRVTLAPPIGRRVGPLYNVLNMLFPFLRTHVVAVIRK